MLSMGVQSLRMNSRNKRGGAFSTQLLATVDHAGFLHIHNLSTGKELTTIDLEHSSPVATVAYEGTDISATVIVSTGNDGSVHVTCLEVPLAARHTYSIENHVIIFWVFPGG